MIWIAAAALVALDVGIVFGWAVRGALEHDRASRRRRVRLVLQDVPRRVVRVAARVTSPEMAGWN